MRLLIPKSKKCIASELGAALLPKSKIKWKKINTVSNALPYTCSIGKRALARQATRGRQMLHIVPRDFRQEHKLNIKFLKISRNILWHLWHLWHVGLSENPMLSWKTPRISLAASVLVPGKTLATLKISENALLHLWHLWQKFTFMKIFEHFLLHLWQLWQRTI